MLHRIMYERDRRVLVEIKNRVGREVRDFRALVLSRFRCKYPREKLGKR